MPKEIEPEEIEAQYRNGVLEVRLPIIEGATARGTSIEVTG
jgi:HSP20 family protein